MIAHLLKLVWNRKRTNLLIVTEIFLAFLVVFALSATGLYHWDLYRDPLGFDYRDVWHVDVTRNTTMEHGKWGVEDAAVFARLLEALRRLDAVESAAGASTAPYKGSVHITGWEYDNRDVSTELAYVTPELLEVLRLDLVAGRWLRPEDGALDWTPYVIDRDMEAQLAGDGEALGLRVGGEETDDDRRVVGIVSDFRRGGEIDENGPFTLAPAVLDGNARLPLRSILVRVVPGTPAAFEEPMLETLQSIAHGWTFSAAPLEVTREWKLKQALAPLVVLVVIAGFLLVMVVLGLTGIMWQNVTRRTREIGLRRAAGAHRGRIHRQIVGEVMLTTGLGLVAGALLAIQVPILGPFAFVSYGIVLPALALSALLILLLAALCGLHPGWSATRVHPAEALHYE